MGSRLVCDINETERMTYIRLSGVIDEDNDLSEIAKRVAKPIVVINTADVDRINSCGVRDWVTWLAELAKKGAEPYLVECSPAIMTQVNLVNNFVGTGTIKSFYAPYFCSACDTDKMLLIDVDEALQSQPFRPPTCRCDQCDHTMEFDDIESSYFAFLATTRKKALAAEVQDAIRRFSKGADGKLRDRSAAAVPVVTGAGSTSASGGSSVSVTPTTPSSKYLKSMLSDSSVTFTPSKRFAPPESPSSPTNKILFVIIGLLVVAIGLLAFVILRST
jgi:anti-anti-sigma regulatory factor